MLGQNKPLTNVWEEVVDIDRGEQVSRIFDEVWPNMKQWKLIMACGNVEKLHKNWEQWERKNNARNRDNTNRNL